VPVGRAGRAAGFGFGFGFGVVRRVDVVGAVGRSVGRVAGRRGGGGRMALAATVLPRELGDHLLARDVGSALARATLRRARGQLALVVEVVILDPGVPEPGVQEFALGL
jgi:hypothetical protein